MPADARTPPRVSDQRGRKAVISLGLASYGLSMLLTALAPRAVWLIPGRIVSGLAQIATYSIGAVYLGATRALGHPDAAALHRLASTRPWT